MIVSKAHVDEARSHARLGGEKFWKLLESHADKEFFDRAKRLILRTESETQPSEIEKLAIMARYKAQSDCLWVIVGTIWIANDRRMPTLTQARLNDVINAGSLSGAEISAFFRKFRDYERAWSFWIDETRERLPDYDTSQRAIYYIAKAFIEALPEPIVDLASPDHPKTSIESQIDDILKPY